MGGRKDDKGRGTERKGGVIKGGSVIRYKSKIVRGIQVE